MDHIVCYDITDPRRLGRVHRLLKKRAMALQYSVFLYSGDHRQAQACLKEVSALIDPRHDDVRIYPLPHRGLRLALGRQTLPEGIEWSGLPMRMSDTP